MKNCNTCVIVIILVLASCVPTQQFREVSDKSEKLDKERNQLMADNERLTVENTEMKAQRDIVEEERLRFVSDSLKRFEEIQQLRNDLTQLTKRYEDLQSANDALLQGSARETRRLLNELQSTQEDLQKKEARLRELEITVSSERDDLNRMSAELEERNVRLAELEKILNRKDSVVNALREKVSNALYGFEGQGLTVELKNGKVYVSLEEQLLFKSGSTEVDPRGVVALKRLVKVLEQNPDINIMIEGHTDDVPIIKGSAIKDNWDLSVMRATAIVRILLDDSRIDPRRLTAAGHGEFLPVDPAKTSEARRKNRRTEIILTPKLDELFRILESN
jgi:chemotaxis protein MotB